MEVLIRVKENINLKDVYSRYFSFHKQQSGSKKLVYIKGNIGIAFLKGKNEGKNYYDDYDYWDGSKWYNNILTKIINEKCFLTELTDELDFPGRLHDYEEFEYIKSQDSFYFMDSNKNIFIILNNTLHLRVKSLYFVVKDGSVYISNNLVSLKEHLSPIYKIDEGIYSFNCDVLPEKMIDKLFLSSKVVYKPILKTEKEKVNFYDGNLRKTSIDVSLDDFIQFLKNTDYCRVAKIYEVMKNIDNDIYKEYDCQKQHKESDEWFLGFAKDIRYIKNGIIREFNMTDSLRFKFIKASNIIIIDTLPKIDDVPVFNELILKIMLDMLYNLTDLSNINDIYINERYISPVIITESILKKFPNLKESTHYSRTLKSIEFVEKIYHDEAKRKQVLLSGQKKERRVMVTTINHNIEKYNEIKMLMQNNASIDPNLNVKVYPSSYGSNYTIINHGHWHRKKFHCRIMHIVEAPEIIDINENIPYQGLVICFPVGTKEIKNLSINNRLNEKIDDIYSSLFEGGASLNPLFIILPSTIDLSTFDFFKLISKEKMVFISDNIQFIEYFRFLRKEYNKNCNIGYHFNCPIIYDGEIYDKIWGYHSNNHRLYRDLKERILSDQKRIEKEKAEIEEYRFLIKKEMQYIPDKDKMTIDILKKYVEGLTQEEFIESMYQRGIFNLYDIPENLRFKVIKMTLKYFYKLNILQELLKRDFIKDPEFVIAINKHDTSYITGSTFFHRYKFYPLYSYIRFYNEEEARRVFLKDISKTYHNLEKEKIYYDLPYVECLKPLFIIEDSIYESLRLCRKKWYDFYKMALAILSNDNLVKSINQHDYDLFLSELERLIRMKPANDFERLGIGLESWLYVYHVLIKSGRYFFINDNLNKEEFNYMMSQTPLDESNFKKIRTMYGQSPYLRIRTKTTWKNEHDL